MTVSADVAHADRAARLAACLERARAGDLSALDEVVHELNPLLWHVARAQGLGPEEAADVVQTTWLELLRRMSDIHTPQALTAWLVTAARREAWHTKARNGRLAAAPDKADVAVPDPSSDVVDRIEADERRGVLWYHFRALPERCRTLLRIVATVDRPDYDIVAQALGMPRGSIGPTRARCLTKLRDLLLADPTWGPR